MPAPTNTPWKTDDIAYNRRRKPEQAVDERIKETKRRMDELEHARLLDDLAGEVWD